MEDTLRPTTQQLMEIRGREMVNWRRRIEIRSTNPFFYNCVGMIFASRRAWIEVDHIYHIFQEDGYRRISLNNIAPGDVILYKDDKGSPTHVAVILEIGKIGDSLNVKVMSKWGKDPEFIHFVEDVPSLLGYAAEYWTDRIKDAE